MLKLSKPPSKKRPIYVEAASDGLVALLTAGKESTDGVPIVKGVLGGILWISETCRQFKCNKQEWSGFANYLSELHVGLLDELNDSVDHPSAGMIAEFRKLQRSVELVATQMISMKERSGFLSFVQVREDPKKILGFRQTMVDAISKFSVLQLVSLRNAMEQLQITTAESRRQTPAVGITNNCPPPTPLFTGRRSVLDQMHDSFGDQVTSRHIFVLYGLGGAGKTQIAYKFIDESQHGKKPSRFSDVLFVDASSEESITSNLRSTAVSRNIGTMEQDTLNWLSVNRKEWLLFFNNADDISLLLSKYFPRCSHGNILITSRNRNARIYASPPHSHHKVSGMDADEARDLLIVAAGNEIVCSDDDIAAIEIVKELGHLSLAIIQAGAYISKTACNLHEYWKLYRECRWEVLEEYQNDRHRVDDYQSSVYTTWMMSFSQLETAAKQFMQLCSCLHFDGIPDTIFKNAALLPPDDPLNHSNSANAESLKLFLDHFRTEEHTWDIIKFNRILDNIQSYSLIDVNTKNQTYSIHPLVHDWIYTTVPDLGLTRAIARYLIACSVNRGITAEDYAIRRALVMHADTALKQSEETDDNVAYNLHKIYFEAGRWKEAQALVVAVTETRKHVLGKEHPDTLESINSLAFTYMSQGRWKEAEALETTVVETRKRVLGEEHTDTLDSIGGLTTTYLEQGRWKEAEALAVALIETSKHVLGAQHLHTLNGIDNLARAYLEQGRWKEAEELEEALVQTRKHVLGEEHPYTLQSTNNLAYTYWGQGRWKEAEKLEVAVVEATKRVLGEEHPDTLQSINNLACTYWSQGRWNEAEALEVVMMETRKRVIGEEHPDTLNSIGNLAGTYLKQGRWEEAEALNVALVETRKRVLGEEHPDTLNSIDSLAGTYRKQGRWKEAEKLYVALVETRKRVLGEEHPDTLTSIGNLAGTYQKQGQWKEAETLYVALVEARKRVLGQEHLDTQRSIQNLASMYSWQGGERRRRWGLWWRRSKSA